MPGLNQLKQFNEDLLNLGDEVKIRSTRGEKPVTVPIPSSVSEEDDAEDFRLGMPQISDEEVAQADALEAEKQKDESADFDGAAPNMSDLLSPASDMDLDDLDLSEFEEAEPVQEAEPEEAEEVPLEDQDLDSLLAVSEPTAAEPTAEAENTPPVQEQRRVPRRSHDEDDSNGNGIDDELDSLIANATETEPATSATDAPDFTATESDEAIDMNEGLGDALNETEAFPSAESAEETGSDAFDGLDLPSFDDAPAATTEDTEPKAETEAEPKEDLFASMSDDDFTLPDIDLPPTGGTEAESAPAQDFASEMPDISEEASAPLPTAEAETTDTSTQTIEDTNVNGLLGDLDIPDFPLDDSDPFADEGGTNADSGATDEDDGPIEQFDTSAMEGMDFSSTEDDAFGDDDFHIPGFSDTTTADFQKAPKPDVATPDFSDAKESSDAQKPKNTFTDAEYKRFKKNLAEYPLNVRIALEDFVAKNEFTDDAVFEILEKVLRKVPARQLATSLEKLLDISLDVPRDFERRTASEYEAYKQSLEFKLKNRIIPGAILTTLAAILVLCVWTLTRELVYKPMRANHLYKEGYQYIQSNEYALSEDKFNDALAFKSVRSWFFKYAESYRDHKQYERARKMYWALLNLYKHDKQAGLDWADMEANELYNYSEAERILKREVLDYHINDPEAILKLGDVYLDWADDGDTEKYELAKEQYDLLLYEYGDPKQQDLYLARQMRYFIRMDNLEQVLSYKDIFYPSKIKSLGREDITELSGYLLDKRFGVLRPAEESLRGRIEDVRPLLEAAVKKDESNPTALYNLGRYYVNTSNARAAELFKTTLEAFKAKTRRTRRDTYTFINTYRLLGEEYAEGHEYILSQQAYNDGIALYEEENKGNALIGTEDVGKLYADLGDINYFINGDMDAALNNYTRSVENQNDNASVRYKIGYIQYGENNLANAQGSFIKGLETDSEDEHLLLALANTLSLRGSNQTARGYYERLLSILSTDFDKFKVVMPQVRTDQGDLVDTYMKATNNLGVTLSRLAELNGDSDLNGKAIVNLQESIRSWDSLTRNQETMVRLPGSNLAEQNIKYISNPTYGYTPAIYTDIPKTLYGEEGLEQ